MTKKKAFIQSFNLEEKPEDIFDAEVLKNVKKNFNFEHNPETNMIEVSSRFNVTEDKIDESIGQFEKTLESKVIKFLDDFSKLKFYIKGEIRAEQFVGHDNVEVTDNELGV